MSSVQTMKSWSRLIKSYEDVPRAFMDFFMPFSSKEIEFPYTIFVPAYKLLKNKSDTQIVYIYEDKINFLYKEKAKVTSTVYDFKNINYIEIGCILLRSWIKIEGLSNGKLTSSIVEFNTVTQDYFLKVIDIIRKSVVKSGQAELGSELKKFDFLFKLNYKFANYARQCLLAGETVINMVLQPDLRVKYLSTFRNIKILKIFDNIIFKTITSSHLNILTDNELIIIKDAEKSGGSKYGGIWTFIPYNRIQGMKVDLYEVENFFNLTIQLPGGGKITSIFDNSNKSNLDVFLNEFSKTSNPRVLNCV